MTLVLGAGHAWLDFVEADQAIERLETASQDEYEERHESDLQDGDRVVLQYVKGIQLEWEKQCP